MTPETYDYREPQLDRLFETYKEACGSPEPGANFMPALWKKIESRQSRRISFARIAKSLAAAAAAVSLALGMFLAMSIQQPSAFYSGSYVEAIASDHASEFGTFAAPPRLELLSTENGVQ